MPEVQRMPYWLKTILWLGFMAALLYFLSRIGGLVRMVVIAALLAYMLDPLVRIIECRGVGRTVATAIVFVSIVVLTTIFIVLLVPQISHELVALKKGLTAGKGTSMIKEMEATLEDRLAVLGMRDLQLFEKFQLTMKNMSSQVYGYFLNAVTLVTSAFIIPFLLFFMLKDGPVIIKQFISFVPNRYFEFTLNLLHKTDKQLGGYIRGQFMDAAIIGILQVLAFWVLDLKYFLILGVLIGVSNLVPFVGPIVGAVPAILVSIIDSGGLTQPLYVAISCVVVQIIDNSAVKPIVVAKMVSLHPMVVLLTVVIGGKFFGIMGMLLSVPVVGVTKVIAAEALYNLRKYRYSV